ncbi:hypothetical protein BDV18DRAFT_163281 [Aspergillus unguis]
MSGSGDGWRGGRAFDQNRQRNPNSKGMSGPRGGQQSSNAPSTSWADEVEQDSDQHTPVGGFNAAEAKGALRRGPGAPRPYFYRPQGKDANNRAGGPWGAKPNTMANGKDFFLELRKQVTALRQGDNVAGG